jgi:hypothetical protein
MEREEEGKERKRKNNNNNSGRNVSSAQGSARTLLRPTAVQLIRGVQCPLFTFKWIFDGMLSGLLCSSQLAHLNKLCQ